MHHQLWFLRSKKPEELLTQKKKRSNGETVTFMYFDAFSNSFVLLAM